jgi:hypothetical protein
MVLFTFTCRFYGDLNDFLPLHRRRRPFEQELKEIAAVKDVIEALGVPHPEVDLILVNGISVGFGYQVQSGDRLSVYPLFRHLEVAPLSRVRPPAQPEARFVLDVHLGKLANYLRLLGFDACYRNDADDAALAMLASREQRILLTQDRGLLKRRVIVYGYCVRNYDPVEQLIEVLRRFKLQAKMAPFRRCLRCNGLLQPVAKAAISTHLFPKTARYYDQFRQCQRCQQVYWNGPHVDRMHRLIDRVNQRLTRHSEA